MLKLMIPMITMMLMSVFMNSKMWHTLIYLALIVVISSIPMNYNPMLDVNYTIPLFQTNSLSAPLITLSLLFIPLMLTASYMIYNNKLSSKLFTSTVIILVYTLTMAFSTSNMLLFYMMFELSLMPTAMLIMMWGYQPERLISSTYLILYTISYSLPLLAMMIAYFMMYNTLSFSIPNANLSLSSTKMLLMTICFLAAFLVKLPMYMLHLWLPKAHVEAPVAGSMILAGILLKLGVYGLLKMIPFTPFFNTHFPLILMSISLIGASYTAMICIQQTDIKMLIAYASVSHMGITLAAICTNYSWAWNAALYMSIAHGLASSALFVLANYTYNLFETRNLMLIKGLKTMNPALTFWWFLFAALNLAAPPSLNFLSELLLASALVNYSYLLTPSLIIILMMSSSYSLLLYSLPNHGPLTSLTNPNTTVQLTSHFTLLLHFIPLMMLMLTPNIMLWV